MAKMKTIEWVAIVLLIVGGLNWGLVGIFNFNLVETLFGAGLFTKIIYGLVGLGAVFSIFSLAKLK